ncbi:uncharacterized protein LOC141492350 [Macrotis lagotis]|uniref:uncharacterized protein LOC141492350 n=1 Tax=Macrotis lagotis TaxID=92651 RepID=UPI003D680FB6
MIRVFVGTIRRVLKDEGDLALGPATDLLDDLRVQCIEREKAEQKAAGLEKKLADATHILASFMNLDMEGQDDPPEVLVKKDNEEAILAKNLERESIFLSEKLKVWDRCQHDLFPKDKRMSTIAQSPVTLNWETKTTQTQHQSFISELATLLSNTFITVPATEEAVRERIQELSMNEQSWKYKTDVLQQEIQLRTRQVEQLHQLYQEVVCHSSQSEEKFLEQTKFLKFSEGKSATDDLFQGNWNLDKKKSIAWSNRENLNPTGDQVMMGREGGYDSSRNIFMSLLRQKHMNSLGCQTLLSKNVPDPKVK